MDSSGGEVSRLIKIRRLFSILAKLSIVVYCTFLGIST